MQISTERLLTKIGALIVEVDALRERLQAVSQQSCTAECCTSKKAPEEAEDNDG